MSKLLFCFTFFKYLFLKKQWWAEKKKFFWCCGNFFSGFWNWQQFATSCLSISWNKFCFHVFFPNVSFVFVFSQESRNFLLVKMKEPQPTSEDESWRTGGGWRARGASTSWNSNSSHRCLFNLTISTSHTQASGVRTDCHHCVQSGKAFQGTHCGSQHEEIRIAWGSQRVIW